MRLIDADDLYTVCKEVAENDCLTDGAAVEVLDIVCEAMANTKTIDAVEVVRCGKCVESYDELCRDGYTWCNKYNQVLDINGFCSYGARKETKE